jgi:hypothetical protein
MILDNIQDNLRKWMIAYDVSCIGFLLDLGICFIVSFFEGGFTVYQGQGQLDFEK